MLSQAMPILPNIPPKDPALTHMTTLWISTMTTSAKMVENSALWDQFSLNQPIAPD